MKLKISQLDGQSGTQLREFITHSVVDDYAEAMKGGIVFPPIVVFTDGETYWIADGFHRVSAHVTNGWKEIEADVRQGTLDDALDYACSVEANGKHGVPRSIGTKRNIALSMVTRHRDWSDRKIGAYCGISKDTVGRARPTVAHATVDEPSPEDEGTEPAPVYREGLDGRKREYKPKAPKPTVETTTVITDTVTGEVYENASVTTYTKETLPATPVYIAGEEQLPAQVRQIETLFQSLIGDRASFELAQERAAQIHRMQWGC